MVEKSFYLAVREKTFSVAKANNPKATIKAKIEKMDKKLFQQFYKMEESHWWFKARRDMILRLISGIDKNSKILDLGCGAGHLISEIQNFGI